MYSQCKITHWPTLKVVFSARQSQKHLTCPTHCVSSAVAQTNGHHFHYCACHDNGSHYEMGLCRYHWWVGDVNQRWKRKRDTSLASFFWFKQSMNYADQTQLLTHWCPWESHPLSRPELWQFLSMVNSPSGTSSPFLTGTWLCQAVVRGEEGHRDDWPVS